MGESLKFDYYYGVEAEQFSFYRVPRLLIKDERFKGLSSAWIAFYFNKQSFLYVQSIYLFFVSCKSITRKWDFYC